MTESEEMKRDVVIRVFNGRLMVQVSDEIFHSKAVISVFRLNGRYIEISDKEVIRVFYEEPGAQATREEINEDCVANTLQEIRDKGNVTLVVSDDPERLDIGSTADLKFQIGIKESELNSPMGKLRIAKALAEIVASTIGYEEGRRDAMESFRRARI